MKIDLTLTIGSLKEFSEKAAAAVSNLVSVKSGKLKSSVKGVASASEKELESGVEAEDYIEFQKNKAEIDKAFSTEADNYVRGRFNDEAIKIINDAVVKTLKKK
jgi:ribosomal protein RSM22 (predicted rRNA methylase)